MEIWMQMLLVLGTLAGCGESRKYLEDVPPCVPVVKSSDGKNGTVKSPNYPNAYPKMRCRYDFVGEPNERVQLVFTDFNLYHPETTFSEGYLDGEEGADTEKEVTVGNSGSWQPKELDCGGADILSSFVYAGEDLSRVDDYCGSTTPLAVMSNGPKLTLEFIAPHSSQYVRGFSALYSFTEDYGIKTGRQLYKDSCKFEIKHTNSNNGTGTIVSPNYPGLYPRDTECHYFFYGKENEHVELHFTYFHVDGIPPCDKETHSDYVEFSNYIPIDRKYDRKCGTEKGFKVKSDRQFFRVTFRSNDYFDATGFSATYQFSDIPSQQLTLRNIRTSSGSWFLAPKMGAGVAIFIGLLVSRELMHH